MERHAVDLKKGEGAADAEYRDADDYETDKGKYLVTNRDKHETDHHNDELPGGDRSDYLVLDIDELWNGELLHNIMLIQY